MDVKAIQEALDDGDIRNALRKVDGGIALAPEPKAHRVLPSLFPQSEMPIRPRSIPAPEPPDVERFCKEIPSAFLFAPSKRGSGPGGGCAELWGWMPKQEAHWPAVQKILMRFALGRVPAVVMAAYMSCRVIAGDRAEADKVRPLALGNFFRKCVNRAKSRVFQSRVLRSVAPYQYACGGSRNAEAMHKTALADLDSRATAGLHSFDVKNAHNEFEHEAALDAIEHLIPEMLPWAEPELSTPTSHVYSGPSGGMLKLRKDRGGDQGDPFVGLVFPLTYHSVIQKTEAAARTSDPKANAYGYQDDLDLVLLPEAMELASSAYQSACAVVGLRSNAAKETFAPGRQVDPSSLPPGTQVLNRAIVLRHGALDIPVLPASSAAAGSQLAENSVEVTKLIEDRRKLYARLEALAAQGLPHQEILTLLQQRTGGDAVFLARTCGIPANDAIKLDDDLRTAVKRFSDQPGWTEHDERRLFLPGAELGLGFSSVELTAKPALTASWHANLAMVSERLQLESPASLITLSPWFAKVSEDCKITFREAAGHSAIFGDPNVRLRQRDAARVATSAISAALVDEASVPGRAAMRSSGGPGAAAWLQPPCKPHHHLSNRQLGIAIKTRLDMDIPGCCGVCKHRRPDGSICGQPLDAKGVHARSCAIGGWKVRRHDALCGILADWAEEQNCAVEREVAMPHASPSHPEARMDLVIRAPGIPGPINVDLTVVCATTAMALRHGAATRDGAACEAAGKAKKTKYSNIAVVPFAIEEHGRIGSDAQALAKRLAPRDPSARSDAMRALHQALGCTLQRTQADAVITAMCT